MKPKFKPTSDGLAIVDPIERKQYQIETNTSVTPTSVSDDCIPYPLESAVEITTNGFRVLSDNSVYVRNSSGSLVTEVKIHETVTLPRAEYHLDISGPLKVYATIESAVDIRASVGQTLIEFEEPTSIVIGARSYHTSPAATITTTTEPTDVMQAISMFGSALKTTTPERSYPTLRGHPPAVELGADVEIPDELSRPQTGVRIEIPPTLQHTFVVAPLAYYLAAAVVPGPTPRLVTEAGYSYPLKGEHGFERRVEQVFKHIFLLDCIVRTEGETPLPLYERQAVEPILEFDIEAIYEQPLAEQLETYLAVPFETIQPHLPEWQFEVQLSQSAKNVESLPFLTDLLATINVENTVSNPVQTSQMQVQRAETDSNSVPIRQSWRGDQTGVTGTGTLLAFENRITQSPRDGPLEIEVICNDSEMSGEFVTVNSAYHSRNDLPLDVTVHYNLTTDELEEIFTRESDFVHYIGHIDSNGFRCSDGTVDAGDFGTVGAKAFLLNACQSYEQGLRLIEGGAIGGIVTFSEIENSDAVFAGRAFARLLNFGLPLYGALDMFQKTRDYACQYHLVGDGTLSVVQTNQGLPTVGTLVRERGEREVVLDMYPSSHRKLGGVSNLAIESIESFHLAFGELRLRSVTTAELVKFLNTESFPVLLDGELRWSTAIKTHEL
ncbi:hypothetical protein [Natronorubrum sp. A-ect3]|uniref:hypothetical protein n=1 Tax=Natronorubrum sp. A-ect3 TaxID=3242698 RepID=UPI00359E68E3